MTDFLKRASWRKHHFPAYNFNMVSEEGDNKRSRLKSASDASRHKALCAKTNFSK